jgi:SpoVK/Ycf46/Vps4 family AAA+-type ATPase
MIEPGEVKKYYRWNSGFRRGQVECYLAETETDVYFESGKSISKSAIDTEMTSVNESEYLQSNSQAQSQKTIEETYSLMMGESSPEIVPLAPAPLPKEKSPIRIILERQKKVERREIKISLEIDIPPVKVIDLLTTMFDEDEVYQEIVESSLNFSDSDLKEVVKNLAMKEIQRITKETE